MASSEGLPKLIVVRLAERLEALRPQVEVLVVTATPTEKRAVLARMVPLPSHQGVLKGALGPATYYVGLLGAHTVALVMCRMGAVGDGAARDAVAEGCKLWEPRAAIMVGIAFGKDASKQGIGDVLVASQLISYAEVRVGAKKREYRGPIVEASGTLVDRFRNVDGWELARADGTACEVRVGAVLSGEELIDDPDRKAELFAAFSQAIGGEMEGRGLYAAASRAGVAWILVKAICDWADGTKHKKDQPFAARAAVDLVHQVLVAGDALDGLPAKKVRAQEEGGKPTKRKKGPGSGAGGVTARDITGSVVITGNANNVSLRGKR